ncbi:hypothetical protein SAMN05444410_10656 [Hydrobacter penzbergensis]|jgi:hypothetical protein|uniref:Uncharacterized protein n=1 Tax=Hydrobacter penzbergensis TaxID=1235997 RepID=A0A8X8IF66_9BACT|nr:hypothetical protein [Hydrobacter penzbergensis]SDW82511.1 hypothetical protein SAMN05444410_10656 [Hydrobacter penzbergensis]
MKQFYTIVYCLLATIYCCHAQLPVSKEPRHHNVFENAWVRVLDVRIPPRDTSLFHRHEIPSVFLVLTKTKTGSQAIVEPARPNLSSGNIWYESFEEKPRVHRVWNNDTSEFHAMDIELLRHAHGDTSPLPEMDHFTLLFDEAPVRAYRIMVDAHTNLHLTKRATPVLIIKLTDEGSEVNVNGKLYKKRGDFSFIDADQSIDLNYKGAGRVPLAFFELK